jgi:hypothetical protein
MRSHDRIQLQGLWGLTLLDLAKNLAFARLGPYRSTSVAWKRTAGGMVRPSA